MSFIKKVEKYKSQADDGKEEKIKKLAKEALAVQNASI